MKWRNSTETLSLEVFMKTIRGMNTLLITSHKYLGYLGSTALLILIKVISLKILMKFQYMKNRWSSKTVKINNNNNHIKKNKKNYPKAILDLL